jgi:hypothetical protein
MTPRADLDGRTDSEVMTTSTAGTRIMMGAKTVSVTKSDFTNSQ